MGLWRESGTAAIVAVVGCSLGQGLYCSASGASVDDLACQCETDSSIYQYRIVCVPFVGVYLVADIEHRFQIFKKLGVKFNDLFL